MEVQDDLLPRAKKFIRSRLSAAERTDTITGLESFLDVRPELLLGIAKQAATRDGVAFDLDDFVRTRIDSFDEERIESFRGLIEKAASKRCGIIEWWATSDARRIFGAGLADMAGYTLTIPPTTASTERLFSALGMRVSQLRTRTRVDNAVNQLKVSVH